MKTPKAFEFCDLQALLRFGHGKLTDTCFMLLDIADAHAAKRWLKLAPVSRAEASDPPPDTALQIAFSAGGLRALGLGANVLDGFSDEFVTGMAGDESRSRRLGDVGANAPSYWDWGGDPERVPHVLLLLYALQGGIDAWRKTVEAPPFTSAFRLRKHLPTRDIGPIEPFGFADGVSQPKIDWAHGSPPGLHGQDRYSNRISPGEFVLGYPNEYGQYTRRPLIDPRQDPLSSGLPHAADAPSLKDLGRNGSYLVIRQLHQDVPGFWQFVDEAAGTDPEAREALAAAMVGRLRDGTPLVAPEAEAIPGISPEDHNNHFTYAGDPRGHRCPVGAHIRRANPRTGDFPPGVRGKADRLIKMFGFGQRHEDEDLIASARFHRLLRRGRSYGPLLAPEDAVRPDAPVDERGIQFIVLVANISRQFEFVQNAWSMSSTFGGVQHEQDPLLGVREPLWSGDATDHFHRPDPAGPMRSTSRLPRFVTVRGGGYFFMPGLRALQYIAASPPAGRNGMP